MLRNSFLSLPQYFNHSVCKYIMLLLAHIVRSSYLFTRQISCLQMCVMRILAHPLYLLPYLPLIHRYTSTCLSIYLSIYLSLSLSHHSLTVDFTSFFTILIELHHPSLTNYPLLSHHVKRSYSTSHEETSAKSSAKLSRKAGWDSLGLDNETLKKNEN